MHRSRFDQITRQVAARSRRDILRAMLAAALTHVITPVPHAAAQLDGVAALGSACLRDAECRQMDAATFSGSVTCADNGFSPVEALTCCVGQSSCCASDADCCGELRCASGGEICNLCLPPPFPTRSDNQVCTSHAECLFNYACGPTACINQRCACLHPNAVSEGVDHTGTLDIPDTDAAMIAAESLSILEGAGEQRSLAVLYRAMHPDAQAVIPEEAVVGWYEHDFPYAGEPVAVAIKVHFAPWTWAVTGKQYPRAAEVATRRYLTNGTVQRELVHLVQDDYGTWSWFFGNDRAFVAAQIARFSPSGASPLS